MAADINEQLSNMYNAAAKAIQDDLQVNFYNAAQARNQAFRQLNNNANARHALYSGMPAATQMQYDQQTYLPGVATMAQQAINKQIQNQESWDEYMDYIKELNSKAAEYNEAAQKMNTSAAGMVGQEGTSSSGGLTSNPTEALENFAGN